MKDIIPYKKNFSYSTSNFIDSNGNFIKSNKYHEEFARDYCLGDMYNLLVDARNNNDIYYENEINKIKTLTNDYDIRKLYFK